MRPLPAVPGVESIVVLDMHDAWSPMVINIDMIEADVPVIKVVPPAPAIGPPPWMAPGPQPFPSAKPEAKPNPPINCEPYPKPVRTGPAHPDIPDIRRIVIASSINHDIVRADLSTEVTGRVSRINHIGRRAVNPSVSYVVQRGAYRDAINNGGDTRGGKAWFVRV